MPDERSATKMLRLRPFMDGGYARTFLEPKQRYDLIRVVQNDGYCGCWGCCAEWPEDTTQRCPKALDVHINRAVYLAFEGPRGDAFAGWLATVCDTPGEHTIPAHLLRDLERPHWLLDHNAGQQGEHVIPEHCYHPLSEPSKVDQELVAALFERIPAERTIARTAPRARHGDSRGPRARRR